MLFRSYTYDDARDAFIPPRPFDAFILNEESCNWDAPFPAPQDGKMYFWDGTVNQWKTWDYVPCCDDCPPGTDCGGATK